MISNARDGVSLSRTDSLKCLFKSCSSSLQQRETLSKIFSSSQHTLALVIVNRHFDLTSVFIFFPKKSAAIKLLKCLKGNYGY